MPRRRTSNTPGHAHELTFSCFRRLPLLSRERNCSWLAESIDAARERLRFHLRAYVFMLEHVHLIVKPSAPDYDMGSIRTAIKSPVSKRAVDWLDKRRGRLADVQEAIERPDAGASRLRHPAKCSKKDVDVQPGGHDAANCNCEPFAQTPCP
ncbi:hypothetical protein [Stratiformator vulcanicus]|uniref:Transposase IS200 like protein n=1 Tax=Stratiformator vulcanicus TaxID=2527980 RepID=A0A517R1D6_9PLAN|nr:hypothetical protein [Stratiformator vulcanicus]QDT37715.1 hypothetical protein Pan189_20970 [Stratiformator vulcanicus]